MTSTPTPTTKQPICIYRSARRLRGAMVMGTAMLASSVFAQYTFVDGSVSVAETSYLAELWDILMVSSGLPASTATTKTTNLSVDGYEMATFAQPISSVTTSAGMLTTASSAQAAWTMTHMTFKAVKHTLTISNLNVDIDQRTVYADFNTEQGSFLHQAWLVPIETPDPIASGSTGSPKLVLGADGYMHATGSLTNLTVAGTWDKRLNAATGALSIMDRGLGITGVSQGALYAAPYADISYDVRLAVPEPSTYSLILAGLTSMAALAYRSRKGSVIRAS